MEYEIFTQHCVDCRDSLDNLGVIKGFVYTLKGLRAHSTGISRHAQKRGGPDAFYDGLCFDSSAQPYNTEDQNV